ncbi:hypothetical protein QTG59_000341 [Vibrio parahaemolyticus]|nr:hypothetical protein [Vibrio parahaemolyticus]ELA9570219.1 hypothetical protein [Vibrio parahaemolyticus]
MSNELASYRVIPFEQVGRAVLLEIERRVKEYRTLGNWYSPEWAGIYENTYHEVKNYLSTGEIPTRGFSMGLGSFVDVFKRPVLDAKKYLVAAPVGTLNAFYAICTSSAHTSEIRSRVNYNDAIHFNRALSNDYCTHPDYRTEELQGCFGEYIVERGYTSNEPFTIKAPYNIVQPLVFGRASNDEIVRKFRTSIFDAYNGISPFKRTVYKTDTVYQNLNLEVLFIGINPIVNQLIESIKSELDGVKLADGRVMRIAEVVWGRYNREWSIPNCRLTIQDDQKHVECYLTIRFIPLPTFEEMIAERAQTLKSAIGRKMNFTVRSQEAYSLANILCSDLDYVKDYRFELKGGTKEVNLQKYDTFMNTRGLHHYPTDDLPSRLLNAAYQLLETYNHHINVGERVTQPLSFEPLTTDENKVLDNLYEHICHRLGSFGKTRENYSNKTNTGKYIFKREPQITAQLMTYLEDPKYIVQRESDENTGNVDIKIDFKDFHFEPLMIEVKLLKPEIKKPNARACDLLDIVNLAVHQISEYTRHMPSKGMLLFFTLDLNEAEVAREIELNKEKLDFEFIKVHPKSKIRHKITHYIQTNEDEYPVRFMKLKSKTPSQGK